MKKLIVLLLALTLLTSFVAPAMARPSWWGACECADNCGLSHAQGHPLCAMPNNEGGVPPGPPYAPLPANAGGQCQKECVANPHATG
jgi:hypothetical protein